MIMNLLAVSLRDEIKRKIPSFAYLQEIRLRVNQPVFLQYHCQEVKIPHILTREELRETLEYISTYSLYAYEKELGQGFLTVAGGHRVGICGKILYENGRKKSIQSISSLNIRVAHEIKGCADVLFPDILERNDICHTLLLSPPGCGKTTLLRDLIRQASQGNQYINGRKIGIVDERSELASSYLGVPQNEVGCRTDILEGCSKEDGMMLLLRTMSPEVLAVDEIGSKEELKVIESMEKRGVTVFATAHGDRSQIEEMGQWFSRIVFLRKRDQIGEVEGIYDGKGRRICG